MLTDSHLGAYKHGNLPHMDFGDYFQFVTFVLADAAPKQQRPRSSLGLGWHSTYKAALNDKSLDQGYGSCILQRPEIANIVVRSINLKSEVSHNTIAWVIMPNHVHLLFQQKRGCPLSKIVKQIKGGSAHNIRNFLALLNFMWVRPHAD